MFAIGMFLATVLFLHLLKKSNVYYSFFCISNENYTFKPLDLY